MAKPKSPLLSFGARGTIGGALTFQKRGRTTIVRQKPIPENPRSEAQLAQRQKYKEAVASWHSLTPEQKEAWRGICPGLTSYQCFMRSELKYMPPPIPIDIGSDPIDRASTLNWGYTYVDRNNPANASGTLHSVKVYSDGIFGLIVGTFYTTNGNTLKCRDSVNVGDAAPGLQTVTELSLEVQEGDYIGCYFATMFQDIDADLSGFAGVWQVSGEFIDPGDEAEYTFYAGDALSLYGTGEGPA
ncbi:hypothetical protein ES708_31346 [subsurface metagenome]